MKILRLSLGIAVTLAAGSFLHAEPVPPRPAPAWKLKDVDGKVVSSDQFKGKVLVVDFWATWCGPCRREIPGYIELQKKYGKDGLVIVGMAVNDPSVEKVKQFVAEHHMNYIVLMEGEDVLGDFGGTDGIPTTFIIDRAGNIRDRKVGAEDTAVFEKALLPYLK